MAAEQETFPKNKMATEQETFPKNKMADFK